MALVTRWTDFLPDAQGLVERRASPLASVLIFTIAALVAALVGWSAWARVEQVVRADGAIEPQGRIKLINHPQGGRIAEILVKDGDRVAAGDVLLRFDPEIREGEQADIASRLATTNATLVRLSAEAEGHELIFPPELESERDDLVQGQTKLYLARARALAGEKQALDERIQAKNGDVRAAIADVARLRNSLSLQRQQLDAVADLAARELYPRLKLVAAQQQVAEAEGQLAKAEQNLVAVRAELEEVKTRRASLDKDRQAQVLSELAAAAADRDRLTYLAENQAALMRGLTVTAPVAGIVQELQVSAMGQAVAANQPLMKLIPTEEGLIVKARVKNSDIGHIKEGMDARIKIHAFDFIRYGTLSGVVEQIAPDARRDRPEDAPVYEVTVRTTGSTAEEHGRTPPKIQPGMLVDVEIEVGDRTVLAYFTDRLRRVGDEALSEF